MSDDYLGLGVPAYIQCLMISRVVTTYAGSPVTVTLDALGASSASGAYQTPYAGSAVTVTFDAIGVSAASGTYTVGGIGDTDPIYYQDTSSSWVVPFRLDMGSYHESATGGHYSWTKRNSTHVEAVADGGWNNEPYARIWPRTEGEGSNGVGFGARDIGAQNAIDVWSIRFLFRYGPSWMQNNPNGMKFIGINGNDIASTNVSINGTSSSGYDRQQYLFGGFAYQCNNNSPTSCVQSGGTGTWYDSGLQNTNIVVFADAEDARTGTGYKDGAPVNEWICMEMIFEPDPVSGFALGQTYYWTQDGQWNGTTQGPAADGYGDGNYTMIFIQGLGFYWGAGATSDRGGANESYLDICSVRVAAGTFDSPQGPPPGFLTG